MRDAENKELSRLATAVESLGDKVGDIKAGLRAIGQWMDDREKDLARHEGRIDGLESSLADQRDRITRGLTWQAMLPAIISAVAAAMAVGFPLWLKVKAAVSGIGG